MGKLWSTSIHEKQLFLTFFLFLSLGIGIIATCGLTELSWYWNIPIYLVGMLILALISDVISEANTRFHMFF